ncbi:MAG: DUF805 domain-containing protein [Puniceicoccales bacterium]|jgi:uncharacterized membrane protein YhaH (DUF805 family)|nr:DUF805 domain-containing protein [Puniceicoccales bacterium]
MTIFKLYLSSLKKSFIIRGRASRSEIIIFHLVGLVPIALCLTVAWPAIYNIMQQSEQLLKYVTGDLLTLPGQSIKTETFHGLANTLANSSALETFQRKLDVIMATFGQHLPSLFLLLLSTFIYTIPSFAVTIRRLHDINLSGYFYLMQFIPFIGMAIFLVLMLIKGTDGPNRYGPHPF